MLRPLIPRHRSRAYITLIDELPGREFAIWWDAWFWRGRVYRKRKSWMEVS